MARSNSNNNSPRLGARAETRAAQERGYERMGAHEPWQDALAPDGTPIEIKATMRERSNGRPGKFRVFKQPHSRLSAEDGRYLFAVYRQRGTGVQILKMTEIPARAVRIDGWIASGHQTDGREQQVKIPINQVFGR
jgi:hypothetical protein